MEYKKTIILLALVVFILSIAGVSASEIGDTIASENANTIELSTDNDIKDNLQTSEENEALASTDYDEAIAQTDTEVLVEDSAKYSDLAEEIGHSGDITLTHKNYTYDKGETITISEDNKVIDGNGAVIDMNESTIKAFLVSASGVTIKNLTIKNVKYSWENGGAIKFAGDSGAVINCNFINHAAQNGGAIYFDKTGNVTNCNFADNTANEGGAVYFNYEGTVSNCNFTDNSAIYGGAIRFSGETTVTNCNFTNNTAHFGGAVYISSTGNVTNCNFADNSAASLGGAICSRVRYTTADTCIFKTDSDTTFNTHNLPPTLNVNNFTTVYGSGEKLTFDLKTNSSIPVTNGNISISVYFKDNGEWVRNYTCLSGEGWIPDLPVGSYIAFFDTEYAEFQKINRTITTAPEHTFWFLNYTINGNDNPVIELSHDFYFDPAYDAAFVNGIVINRPVTIKGNGNAIDAKRQARIFYVQSENAVLENLTLKNAHSNSEGGAVYFSGTGEVTNCNFTDNKVTGDESCGGAIYMYSGTVKNCSFTNNSAHYGGAIRFNGEGTVTNCNFTDNTASSSGGAVYFLNTDNVTNCNFTNNSAHYGGAILFAGTGNVTNCNFIGNNATYYGGAIYFSSSGTTHEVRNCNFTNNSARYGGAIDFEGTGTVTNCNFTNNKATGAFWGGGAVYFNKNVEGNVTNCNFTNNSATKNGGAVYFGEGSSGRTINCNFTDNTASNYGGAVYFLGTGDVTNCNFTNNSASRDGGAIDFEGTGTVTNCNFTGNNANDGGAVYFNGKSEVTNCNFTGNIASSYGGAVFFNTNGNVTDCNFTGNKATSCGGAVYFKENCIVENCKFTLNTASNGGAIRTSPMCYGNVAGCDFTGNSAFNGGAVDMYTGIIERCNFTGNCASNAGGAVVFSEGGSFADCNFANNNATDHGGAISMFTGNIQNCNFTGNNATTGSAINFYGFSGTNISNSRFLNNRADASDQVPLNVTVNGTTIEITFMGQDNLINAIYSYGDVNFTNVAYWGANGIANTGANPVILSPSDCEAGQNISVTGFVNGKSLKTTKVTDANGRIVLKDVCDYYLIVRHDMDSYYTEAEKIISNMNVNVTSQTTNNRTVNITAKSNIPQDIVQGELLFILPNGDEINATYAADGIWWAVYEFDNYTDYQVNASYTELSNVTVSNATISIVKANSTVEVSDVVLNYGESKGVAVTTEGATGITAKIDGKAATVKGNTVVIPVLDAGTHTLTVTTIPDEDHMAVTKTVKITVSKVKTAFIANAKAFKFEDKTKKYAVALKDIKGRVMKNTRVTLKVNGVTYTATTNAKGIATFALKKLTKQGSFNAVISYAGDKNHIKTVKTVKITVKAPAFKTVSYGSKDKNTVKKIQVALKKNGFYITEKGHYLKVDGIYHKYTVKAVKQFQKAKGLKVTGNVDYTTAKKLKII